MIIKNIKKLDKILLFLTAILLIWGLLSIVSASSRVAVLEHNRPVYYYFVKQLIMVFIGVFASLVIINVPSKCYLFISRILYVIILVILIVLLLTGDETRGAQNWIPIFGFSFQPSEFAKPILIVYLATLFDEYYKGFQRKKTNAYLLAIIAFICCIIPGIIFLQKDFGTMIIIIGIITVLFIGSPIKIKDKWRLVIIIFLLALSMALVITSKRGNPLTEAQLKRIDFINPCSKYETGGYQICNGFIAINDGGLLGLGLGKSRQKYSYIPEPHTDSIFAIISEENGFLRSSIIFILYLLLIYRITIIASRASTHRGRFICIGVATYIFMHIFINLGGLFGLIPLTGVPLPFFSYGGSYVISLIASIGLVERVYIEDKLLKK